MDTVVTLSAGSLAAARTYLGRGWLPIPIPSRSKNPGRGGWQKLRLGEADLPKHFSNGQNIGLLLGEPSGGLIDIDVDATEARALATQFLPSTGRKSGRASAPASHWWYTITVAPKTTKFKAPDGTMLVEVRSSGCQTVVFPSIHPEGEQYQWDDEGDPADMTWDALRRCVAHLAISALLARRWPAQGSRHDCALAVAGVLLRGGLDEAAAVKIVTAAACVAGDAEIADREKAVRDTRASLARGTSATGIPTLVSIIGDKEVGKLNEWLRLCGGDSMLPSVDEAPPVENAPPADDQFKDALAALRKQIRGIRDQRGGKRGIKPHNANREIAKLVFTYLRGIGRFISAGGRGFYFDSRTHKLLSIEKDGVAWNGLLTLELDINPADEERRFVHEFLAAYAIGRGEASEIHVFAFYDRKHHCLYVSIGDGRMCRMDGAKIDIIDNGSEGVLFLDPPDFTPFTPDYNDAPDISIDSLIDSASFERGEGTRLQPKHQKLIFKLWLLSLFFRSLLPTRPIMCLVGEKGSGKTTLLRLVMRTLFGQGEQVILLPDKQEDLLPKLTAHYLVVIDNADSSVKWLCDLLAVSATGGKFTKRVLYTTNQEIDLPLRAYLAITSRTPKFRRDDVADRLLPLNVVRRETFTPEGELLRLVDENRPKMLGRLFTTLNKIVAVLKRTETFPTSRFRMADWAALCWVIAGGSSSPDEWRQDFNDALTGMADLQDAFTLDGDPLIDLFESFAQVPQNLERSWTAKQLFEQLHLYANELGVEFPFANPRQLGQRLAQKATALGRVVGLKFSTRSGAGGVKVHWITKSKETKA